MSSGRLAVSGVPETKGMMYVGGVGARLVLLLAVCLLARATPAWAAGACPNEAVRAEQGAAGMALPECRAYELVSAPGSVPALGSVSTISALNGDRFAYGVSQPAPDSEVEGTSLLATREVGGWSVQNVTPPQGGLHDSDEDACNPSVFYSAELTAGVLSDGWITYEGGEEQVCEGDYPLLVSGEPRGAANLFLRDNEDGSYKLIDQVAAGVAPSNALLEDATPDLSRIVFAQEAALTPEAPAGLDLYEWAGGGVRLVSFLPDGEPVPGTLANTHPGEFHSAAGISGTATFTHAISSSGETVFFYYDGDLYARLHAEQEAGTGATCSAGVAEACTVQIDAAAPGATGPGGDGTFVYAGEDGSRVFFTDSNRLTVNSTAKPEEPDLYEYDLEIASLTDLTVSATSPAEVLGFSGASADGSYVYFVARGVLTGDQVNGYGKSAIRREANLYLYHAGVTTFIATLEDSDDAYDWQDLGTTSRVSPNGQYLAFDSVRPLTDSDNEPLEPQDCQGDRCAEIFLYDAQDNELACASCAQDEEAPTGPAQIAGPGHELTTPESPMYQSRELLEGGRLFFDTRTPLVPQATNGVANVYEYEEGAVHLISSGASAGASTFLDASASGNDVFFATSQGLMASDTDNGDSVYDARVDGGFPATAREATATPACESVEACQAPPSEAPAQLFPASSALVGGGNLTAPLVPITPQPPVGEASTKRSLTRSQKLAHALKVCAKRPRRKRVACKAQAHKQYGAASGGHAKRSGQASGKGKGRSGR